MGKYLNTKHLLGYSTIYFAVDGTYPCSEEAWKSSHQIDRISLRKFDISLQKVWNFSQKIEFLKLISIYLS